MGEVATGSIHIQPEGQAVSAGELDPPLPAAGVPPAPAALLPAAADPAALLPAAAEPPTPAAELTIAAGAAITADVVDVVELEAGAELALRALLGFSEPPLPAADVLTVFGALAPATMAGPGWTSVTPGAAQPNEPAKHRLTAPKRLTEDIPTSLEGQKARGRSPHDYCKATRSLG